MRTGKRTPSTSIPAGIAALSAMACLWACDLAGNRPAPREFFSLMVPDSLTSYGKLLIVLIHADNRDTLDTLWNKRLDEPASLRKLAASRYGGGPVDVYLEGREGIEIPYRLLIEYRGSGDPAIIALPPIVTPDTTPPLLILSGRDTVLSEKGEPYVESGIACTDAKDGNILPQTIGTVDTGALGDYTIVYHCQDKAGNRARDAQRVVTVIPVVDRIPPRVQLIGSELVGILLDQNYIDSGYVCLDDRDAGLPVDWTGSVNTSQIGIYKRLYSCTDHSGNRSPQVVRTVQVINPADSAKPTLIFETGRIVDVGRGSDFDDPVAICIDAKDGDLEVFTVGTVDVQTLGEYPLLFTCSDKAGNRDTATVLVRVTQPGSIRAQQESSIDTLDLQRNPNHGYTGALKFTAYPSDRYITLVKFDLSKVAQSGLKSARIRFLTFGAGTPWPSAAIHVTFRISRVKSSWVEGTGNWYWNGEWQNGGETLFASYVLTDSIRAGSANPLFSNGISPVDKAIARAENLIFEDSQAVSLAYSDPHGSGPIPEPRNLVALELDVTGYVKVAVPERDYGFLITVEGVPEGKSISFLTKEIGDGSFAPELLLSY